MKKVDLFSSFTEGVKEGLSVSLSIFPTIFAMIISINVFLNSNIISDILKTILPIIKIDSNLLSLIVMRPISGSSSLILLDYIFKVNGPDSLIGRLSSVIQGSTDTTIYIIGLYFGSVGIKKIKHSLWLGLLCDLICVIIASIVVNILF